MLSKIINSTTSTLLIKSIRGKGAGVGTTESIVIQGKGILF